MLMRQDYYEDKRNKIKHYMFNMLDNLMNMIDRYSTYLDDPSDENKAYILNTENYVDRNEREIEEHILEAISLQQLNLHEIRWLLGMNRIIRELERVGDQITNIMTVSEVNDVAVVKPLILNFFQYERNMMEWLKVGIEKEDRTILKQVLDHDQHINKLNKGTYQELVDSINVQETITESRVKMVIISRFSERIGDHLVNIAKTYMELLEN